MSYGRVLKTRPQNCFFVVMVGTLIFFNEHIIVKKYQSNKKANKKATKYIYI